MVIEYYTQKLVQGSDSGHSQDVRYSRKETLGWISTDQYRLHKNIHALSHGFFHQSAFLEETKHQFHLTDCCYLVVLRLLYARCKTFYSTLAGNTNRTHAAVCVISAMFDCFLGSLRTVPHKGPGSLNHSHTHTHQACCKEGDVATPTVTGLFNIISNIH